MIVRVPLAPGSSKKIGLKIEGGDWVTNVLGALGKMAQQYGDADKAVAAVMGNHKKYWPYVAFTGHSLGGGLAGRAAIKNGKEAVTFNSAGVHRNSVDGINPATARKCTNFWVTDEILTTLQENPSRLPHSGLAFFAAKKVVVTKYESFSDLPDAAGSKVNLQMEPIRQPEEPKMKEGLRNTITNPIEKQAAKEANRYIDNAMNQYGQGILLGKSNLGGGSVGVPRFEPIEKDNIVDVGISYKDEVIAFYNEAIRRHKMDVVLSLMKAR